MDFPLDFEVRHQDLASNFALKIHALLCRGYLKGRDWFDFSWYVKEGVFPNLVHLQNALIQFGPWAGEDNLTVDENWLKSALEKHIAGVDWKAAAEDVRRFLRPLEQESLSLWSARFFTAKVNQMMRLDDTD